ncbi:PP2C family protein-serine/threonine phosphatase [Halocola ammonii]
MLAHVWQVISNAGVHQDKSNSLRRNLVLANQLSVSILLLTVALLVTFYFIFPDNKIVIGWLLILQVLLFTILALNYFGFNKVTRILLSIGLPLIALFATIQSKVSQPELIHPGSYYNPRYFLIGLVFIPLMIFHIKERASLIFSLAVNLAILIFYNTIHDLLGAAPEDLGIYISNQFFISIASSFAGISLILGMIFLKNSNYRYELKIRDLLKESSQKNEEIESSIRYAERLQKVILPSREFLQTKENTFAVFYLPKDIVSGDFYYIYEREGLEYISVIDCTGHGVPGAFMSLMGHTAIARAVEEQQLKTPNEILDSLQNQIRKELQRHGENDIRDGMDLAFIVLDRANSKLQFAGANSSISIVKGSETIDIKGDRRAIGDENMQPFESQEIDFEKGSMIYLYSDGYRDQFGGSRNKKIGRKRFRELLKGIANHNAITQEKTLEKSFFDWKGETPQTDDVCVVGVRV